MTILKIPETEPASGVWYNTHEEFMPQRTLKVSRKRRAKNVGFISRSQSAGGVKTLKRRRLKGRKHLTPR
jgi:ribosomal protein L34